MTIEEKAKRYDETLDRARKLHETCDSTAVVGWCEYIFPELKESEDERIRKALIENFKWYCGDFLETTKWGKDDNLLVKDIITWLEKQGDQKSLTIDIKSMVDSYEQRLIKNGGVSNSPLVNMCVEAFQHGVENTLDELHLKQILANSCKSCKDEWNAENKEVKKISQRIISSEAKEAMYDKPAWSEEDENVLEDIEEAIINYWHGDTQDILLDWLKSLKERIKQ